MPCDQPSDLDNVQNGSLQPARDCTTQLDRSIGTTEIAHVPGGKIVRECTRAASSWGKPIALPVQQVTKVELYINQVTAKKLGMTMPLLLLARADEVIE